MFDHTSRFPAQDEPICARRLRTERRNPPQQLSWQDATAETMLQRHPGMPLRALWDAFQSNTIFGPKVPMAIIRHPCCGIERRAAPFGESQPTHYPYSGEASPLVVAAFANRLDVVAELLLLGASVETKDCFGWTALHYAAANGDQQMVQELITNGANPLELNNEGYTPMQVATTSAVVAILVANSQEPQSPKIFNGEHS